MSETLTDTSILEGLDFEVSCESGHEDDACSGPARWLRRHRCPGCAHLTSVFVCDGNWRHHHPCPAPYMHDPACCGMPYPYEGWQVTFAPIFRGRGRA